MKRPYRRTAFAAVALLAGGVLLAGCGGQDGSDDSAAPEGWKTLEGPTVSVSYPKGFTEQSEADRAESNDAVATFEEDGRLAAMISIQSDFTEVADAEEAAVAMEGTVQATARWTGTEDISVQGVDKAKKVKLTYVSNGMNNTPEKGATVDGSVITGVDSEGRVFAVRIDAQEGKLSAADQRKIIESIHVTG
ncbi:hypothetical protein [Streptomyces sp. TP-A0874]|uniref:hypothetical protein n=1 Tax=Streptomyces sp. TP-A0874 TaxID=549819 RepID=UPI000853CC91|nr:hypothetical protein [Streptomyces sp. TP-A0874]